jgi:hypothetical protein
VLNGSGQTGHRSGFLRFWGIRYVKLGEVCLWILQLTCSASERLLIHMISITIMMVRAVQRQHSCGALADTGNSDSSMALKLKTFLDSDDIYDF